jgi:hypothetical protein
LPCQEEKFTPSLPMGFLAGLPEKLESHGSGFFLPCQEEKFTPSLSEGILGGATGISWNRMVPAFFCPVRKRSLPRAWPITPNGRFPNWFSPEGPLGWIFGP